MKTLIIDNYDSFSYNIYQIIADINAEEPDIIKNDRFAWEKIDFSLYDNIIISPGPGHPDNIRDFGICKKIITYVDKPILGICLGHQGLASVFGGHVIHGHEPVHGQIFTVTHNDDAIFNNIPCQFKAVRYHSLVVDPKLPDKLQLICWADDGTVMGIKHKEKCIYGVQFHPESICSEYGFQLLKNFNNITLNFIHGDRKSTINHQKKLPQSLDYINKKKYILHYIDMNFNKLASNLFCKIYEQDKNAIWLDSNAHNNDMSKLSVIALSTGPLSFLLKYHVGTNHIELNKKSKKKIIKNKNIFDYIDAFLLKSTLVKNNFPFSFQCGFVGYFGYELKEDTLVVKNKHTYALPDSQFLFCDRAILIDHSHKKCYLLALDTNNRFVHSINSWFIEMKSIINELEDANNIEIPVFLNKEGIDAESKLETKKEDYINAINKSLDYIRNGDSYEICLTNRIELDANINPLTYYLILRQINPAPYSAFLAFDDCQIASSSMERFLKIEADGWVETKPIKGTLPRKENFIEDQQMVSSLKNEIKFKSENLMIVDLLRNDLSIVCKIGTVSVPKLMEVESYTTVHQLVSTVKGKIKDEFSIIDCIKACFPGGSMTGAPKVRTLEIIDELEKSARGIYSGSIGYLSLNGAADLNIVIRTAIITAGKLAINVGGAIIALSDPIEEYEEMLLKSKPLLKALDLLFHS